MGFSTPTHIKTSPTAGMQIIWRCGEVSMCVGVENPISDDGTVVRMHPFDSIAADGQNSLNWKKIQKSYFKSYFKVVFQILFWPLLNFLHSCF